MKTYREAINEIQRMKSQYKKDYCLLREANGRYTIVGIQHAIDCYPQLRHLIILTTHVGLSNKLYADKAKAIV